MSCKELISDTDTSVRSVEGIPLDTRMPPASERIAEPFNEILTVRDQPAADPTDGAVERQHERDFYHEDDGADSADSVERPHEDEEDGEDDTPKRAHQEAVPGTPTEAVPNTPDDAHARDVTGEESSDEPGDSVTHARNLEREHARDEHDEETDPDGPPVSHVRTAVPGGVKDIASARHGLPNRLVRSTNDEHLGEPLQ